ncbi:MAG: DUF6179 domain-containing protein [Clostridiales bacterium]|jgi:hypothetical protein|nr:DUF6179 domain-containing protein [Clostridiales bacterium]
MNNGIDKIHMIDKAKLSGTNYFQSLLEQAQNNGLLCVNVMERIQYECLALLAGKTESYNSGDSSSIPVEKAQSIMDSNLFTIGLCLKTYPHPNDAVALLQNESIDEIYKKGRRRIDAMLAHTKGLHEELLPQLVDTQNVFYRSTMEDGIKGFFKLYYPDFAAQEIHITADYPIYNSIPELAGIEFIQAYVESAYYENQFCNYFFIDDICRLLFGYEENYRELLINIYEPVLLTAIGSIITGADPFLLNITESGAAYLKKLFSEMPTSEILKVVSKAAKELIRRFQCPSSLAEYIQNSLSLAAEKIELAVHSNTLNRVFFTPACPDNKDKIVFSCVNKMNDEQYRKVIEEIGQCRFSQDRTSIIKEFIHSLNDLESVFLDADLSSVEIQSVLRELEVTEISVLLKRYPVISQRDMVELREQEQIFRKSLHNFIHQLPEQTQEIIVKTSADIEWEHEQQ